MAEKKEILKKKKKWYTVLATKEFKETEIGNTTTSEPKSLIGRTLKVSLMNLTRDIKHQNIKLTFTINDVKETQARTEITAYELNSAFVKRLIRATRSKLDHSFITKTKDNVKVRIKPVIVTRAKTKRSILTNLRKKSEEYIKATIEKQDYEEVIPSLIYYKLQKDLKNQLKKVYPLRFCEIRVFNKLK